MAAILDCIMDFGFEVLALLLFWSSIFHGITILVSVSVFVLMNENSNTSQYIRLFVKNKSPVANIEEYFFYFVKSIFETTPSCMRDYIKCTALSALRYGFTWRVRAYPVSEIVVWCITLLSKWTSGCPIEIPSALMFNCLLLVMTTSIMLSFIGANLPVIWYTFFGLISWIDSPLSSKSESSVVELLSGKIGKTERFESCQQCTVYLHYWVLFLLWDQCILRYV